MPDYDLKREMVRTGVDEENGLDFDAYYIVTGREGIAWFLWGYSLEQTEENAELICDERGDPDDTDEHEHGDSCYQYDEPELYEQKQFVRASMVGDDQIELIDVTDLMQIDPDDVCSCGAIGCWSPNATM